MLNYKILLSISLLFILISCDNEQGTLQAKVNIDDIYIVILPNSTEKWATVDYTIENEGEKTINGWEIFFKVHFSNGPYLIAGQSLYYRLEPNEISTTHSSAVLVPEYYDNLLNATLKHIEFW